MQADELNGCILVLPHHHFHECVTVSHGQSETRFMPTLALCPGSLSLLIIIIIAHKEKGRREWATGHSLPVLAVSRATKCKQIRHTETMASTLNKTRTGQGEQVTS